MSDGPHLVVAVPARDEAARIGAALTAIAAAVDALHRRDPAAGVTVAVAADACTDATAAIAASAGALVIETTAGRVGAARDAAVERALDARPDAVWIANTDADSEVPPGWLIAQVDAWRAGVDLLLGAVRPDEGEIDPALLSRWRRRNPAKEQHRYVHGANLGVRTTAYRAVGGFLDEDRDEDVHLAARCRAQGFVVRSTALDPVRTSARRDGRAPGGFSDYLRALGGGAPP